MGNKAPRRPPALQPGDKIRLVAPASPFDRSAFEAGRKALSALGFEPVVAKQEFVADGFLAGDDASRAARLTRALAEPDTRAVWAIRGGYGTVRTMAQLDLGLLRRADKLLVGFSDLTALLINLATPGGLVCVHGPVITQLARLPAAQGRWLKTLVSTPAPDGPVPLGRLKRLVPGRAQGRLVGGNLSVLASLVGTPRMPSLRGAILFVEDVAEAAYRLDRLWYQLVDSRALSGVRAVVLGELVDCRPGGRGRWSARAVLERAVTALGVPAVSGAAFGHARRNVALPVGVRASLDANAGVLRLLQGAVRH